MNVMIAGPLYNLCGPIFLLVIEFGGATFKVYKAVKPVSDVINKNSESLKTKVI